MLIDDIATTEKILKSKEKQEEKKEELSKTLLEEPIKNSPPHNSTKMLEVRIIEKKDISNYLKETGGIIPNQLNDIEKNTINNNNIISLNPITNSPISNNMQFPQLNNNINNNINNNNNNINQQQNYQINNNYNTDYSNFYSSFYPNNQQQFQQQYQQQYQQPQIQYSGQHQHKQQQQIQYLPQQSIPFQEYNFNNTTQNNKYFPQQQQSGNFYDYSSYIQQSVSNQQEYLYQKENLNQNILQEKFLKNTQQQQQQQLQQQQNIVEREIPNERDINEPIIDAKTAREIKDPSVNYINFKLLNSMYDSLLYIGDLNFVLNAAEFLYTKVKLSDDDFINSQACFYFLNKKNMLFVELVESIYQVFSRHKSRPADYLTTLNGTIAKSGNKFSREVLILNPVDENESALKSKLLKKGYK